jgi:hypothetical protein
MVAIVSTVAIVETAHRSNHHQRPAGWQGAVISVREKGVVKKKGSLKSRSLRSG